jgi:hypothetical protein
MPMASSVVSSKSRTEGTRIWSLMRSSRNAMDAPSLQMSLSCRCYHAGASKTPSPLHSSGWSGLLAQALQQLLPAQRLLRP